MTPTHDGPTPTLSCLEVGPAPADANAVVVWLHGLGANGHDFEPIVPMLRTPSVRYVFPHAPHRPVTINGGLVMPSWYDILTLDEADDRESEADIRRSASQIEALLEAERDAGVPSDRIVLAGFSQGGALALHVGARWPEPLAGLMVLSAYMVLPDAFEAERADAQRDTPAMFAHGTFDPVVSVARGKQAHTRVADWMRGEVPWHEYPMGHEVCPPQIEDIGAWLRARTDAPSRG
jgi:phospholipase/carboxylesterase